MKLISLLAATSLAGLATFALGLALNQHALGLFATACSTLIALVAVRDYAPRRPLTVRRSAPVGRATLPLRLAA